MKCMQACIARRRGMACVAVSVIVLGIACCGAAVTAAPMPWPGVPGPEQSVSFPYLPNSLNEIVPITAGQLSALTVTAYYNAPGALTPRIMRQSVRCFLGPESVDLFVDTLAQPTWDEYVIGTQFSVTDSEVTEAYAEAGAVAMAWLRRYFPGVPDASMRVIFSVKGHQIGIYKQGVFAIVR